MCIRAETGEGEETHIPNLASSRRRGVVYTLIIFSTVSISCGKVSRFYQNVSRACWEVVVNSHAFF
jgi:hypothetical protein